MAIRFPRTDLRELEAVLEQLTGVLGNGAVSGGTITAGSGLTVNVAAFIAIVGTYINTDSSQVVGGVVGRSDELKDNTTNYLFLREDGSWTVNTTGTAPTSGHSDGSALQWGTATTSGGSVTAVSNVRTNFIAGRAYRETLCAAFTPAATGGDAAEYTVPYDPKDGTTSIVWTVRRLSVRVQTAGGAPAVTFEKSTAAGAFSASTLGSVTLGSGASEGSATGSLGTVASGDKIRLNFTALGTAANFTCQILLSQF